MDIATGVQKVRRFVASLSVVTLVASLFVANVAQAATYSDVPTDAWFYTYVEQLAAAGILDTTQSNYRPGDLANRAEASKLLVEAAGLTIDTSAGPSFSDVAPGAWYYQYVETAAKNGVVSGYKDTAGNLTGKFGPGDAVTREQFAKMATNAMALTTKTDGGPHFPDVATDRWSYDFVETLYNWSVVDGYPDGTFGPTKNINRAEIAKMVVGAMNPVLRTTGAFGVVSASPTSATMVDVMFSQELDAVEAAKAANYSIKDVDGNVLAVSAATVSADKVTLTTGSQTAGKTYTLTVSNVMSKGGVAIVGKTVDFKGYTMTVGGDITLARNDASTLAASNIPAGASGVTVLAIDVKGGSTAAVITGLTFKKTGIADNSNILNVFLYDGLNRITSGKTVNSTSNTVTFNPISFEVGANATKTLFVVVDLANPMVGTGTQDFGFTLEKADSVMTNAKSVGGTFPISSNTHTISSTVNGQITVEKSGTISDPQVGQKDAEIAKFKLTTSSEEGAKVSQLAFLVNGSVAASALVNLRLLDQDGKVVATTAGTNSKDLIVFKLDPAFVMAKGDTRTFSIKADLNTGRNNDTIQVYVEENADVVAIGDKYGFGMRVNKAAYDGSPCVSSAGDCSFSTIKGGDVTIAFGGPTAGTLARNAKDATFLTFTVTSLNNVTVDKMTVQLVNQTAAGLRLNNTFFSDPQLKSGTSAFLSSPSDDNAVPGPSRNFVFNDDFSLAAGESKTLSFTMDIENNGAFVNTDEYVATLIVNSANDNADLVIKDSNNKVITKATQLVPTSNVTGKPQKIDAYTLTVAYSSAPAVQPTVIGSTIEVAGLNFTAGTAGDVKVTDLTLGGYVETDDAAAVFTLKEEARGACGGTAKVYDQVSEVTLWDGATPVGTTKAFQATNGKAQFTSLNFTVPAGQTKKLTVKYKLNNVAGNVCAAPIGSDLVGVGITVPNTEIVAQDPNSNSVTITNGATELKPDTVTNVHYLALEASGQLAAYVEGQPNSKLLIAGTTANLVNKYRFHATKEAFKVTKLTLSNETASIAGQNEFLPVNTSIATTATGAITAAQAVTPGTTVALAWTPAGTFTAGDYYQLTTAGGFAVVKVVTTTAASPVSVYVVSNTGAATAAVAPTQLNAEDTETAQAVTVKYKNSAGADETKTAFLTNGVVALSGLDLFVGKDADAYVEVSADVTNSSTGGADMSGKKLKLGLAVVGNDSTKFEAVGQGSSTTMNSIGDATSSSTMVSLANTANVNTMVVRKTAPAFTKQAAGTTLVAGENTLYAVKIAADPAGGVSFGRLVFDVGFSESDTGTEVINSFKLYRGATPLTTTNVNLVSLTSAGAEGAEVADSDCLGEAVAADNGAACADVDAGNFKVIVSFNQEESISAGANETYTLKANVAGVGSGDSLNVRIATGDEATEVAALVAGVSNGNGFFNTGKVYDAVANQGLFAGASPVDSDFVNTANAARNVIWSDKSSDTHSYPAVTGAGQATAAAEKGATVISASGSNDWTNGYLLKVTDLSAQTISY